MKLIFLIMPTVAFVGVNVYWLLVKYGLNKSIPFKNPKGAWTSFIFHSVVIAAGVFLYPSALFLWPIRLLLSVYTLACVLIILERGKYALYAFAPFVLIFLGLIYWSFL